MGKIRTTGIYAGQPDLGAYAGQRGGVNRHTADIIPANIVGDRDRQEGRRALDFCERAFAHFGVKLDDLRKLVHDRIHIIRIFAHNHNPIGRNILCQSHPVAVKYFTPGWRNEANINPIFFGQQAELVRLIDLKIIHSCSKAAHEQQLDTTQKCCPPA